MTALDSMTDVLLVDHGPVADAATILTRHSTLSEHVHTADAGHLMRIEMNTEIPFELWGSGTQALWHLLCAIASSRYEVSLYQVVSRLDERNRRVVALALSTLCGADR